MPEKIEKCYICGDDYKKCDCCKCDECREWNRDQAKMNGKK